MFTQAVICAQCGNPIIKDWSDFVVSSDVIDEGRGMGAETAHTVEADIVCPHCGANLFVSGAIYEYPEGAYNDNDLESKIR